MLALTITGRVVALGRSQFVAELSCQPASTNVVAVAAAEIHSLALSSIFGLNVTNTAALSGPMG